MYKVILNYPHWTGNTKCFCSPAHKCESSYLRTFSLHGSVYFLRKTKMVHGRFVDSRHALLGCGFFVHIESASALQNVLPLSVCDDCEWVGECLCHVCLLVGCIFACKGNCKCIHTCCKHVCYFILCTLSLSWVLCICTTKHQPKGAGMSSGSNATSFCSDVLLELQVCVCVPLYVYPVCIFHSWCCLPLCYVAAWQGFRKDLQLHVYQVSTND